MLPTHPHPLLEHPLTSYRQFHKILVIGLPERSDKRDGVVLSASLTGFEVEFFDAVKGDQVLDKTRPPVSRSKKKRLSNSDSHHRDSI